MRQELAVNSKCLQRHFSTVCRQNSFYFQSPLWGLINLWQLKALQKWEKWFLFHVERSLCWWDIYIFVLTFCFVEKELDKKVLVNFKIYDVTDWKTNEYNTHIT